MELKNPSENNPAGNLTINPSNSYEFNISLKLPKSLAYSSKFVFIPYNYITIDQSDAKTHDKYYRQQKQTKKLEIDSKQYQFFPITDQKSSYILASNQKEIRIYNQDFDLLKQINFEGNISHLCSLPSQKQPSALFLSNNSIYLLDSDKIEKISDDNLIDDLCTVSGGIMIYKSGNNLFKQDIINKKPKTDFPPLVRESQRLLKVFSFNLDHIGIVFQDLQNKSMIFVQILQYSAEGELLKSNLCKHILTSPVPDNINFEVATYPTSCVFCVFNSNIGFLKFYQCPILSLFKEIGTIPAVKPSEINSIDISDEKIIFHSKIADTDKFEAKIYTIGHNQYSLPYPSPLALQFMTEKRIIPLPTVVNFETMSGKEEVANVEEETAFKKVEPEKEEIQPIKSTEEVKQNEPIPQQTPPQQVQTINQPQVVSITEIPKINPEIFRKLFEEEKEKIISELITEINKDLTEFIHSKLPEIKNLMKDVNTLRKQFEDCIIQYLMYDAIVDAQNPAEEDVLCDDDTSDQEEAKRGYDSIEEKTVEEEDVLISSEIYEDAIQIRKQLMKSFPKQRNTTNVRRIRRIIH